MSINIFTENLNSFNFEQLGLDTEEEDRNRPVQQVTQPRIGTMFGTIFGVKKCV